VSVGVKCAASGRLAVVTAARRCKKFHGECPVGEAPWNQRKCAFIGCRDPAKCWLKRCGAPRKCSLLRLRFFETNTLKLAI